MRTLRAPRQSAGGLAVRKTKWLGAALCCCALAFGLLCAPMPEKTRYAPAVQAACHAPTSRTALPLPALQTMSAQADAIPFYLDSLDTVYVTKTGYCYHAIPDCINSTYTYEITGAEAIRLGYKACSNCEPFVLDAISPSDPFTDEDTLVYMMVQDEHYHASDTCKAFDKPEKGRVCPRVQITLDEAKYLEKDRCPVCNPPKY